MTKSVRVRPESLHQWLVAWGRWASYADFGVQRGYPAAAAFVVLKVDNKTWGHDSCWEISASECSQLDKLINALDERHKLALIRAYRPAKQAAAEEILHGLSTSPRTWTHWAHEAAALLVSMVDRDNRQGYTAIETCGCVAV